MCQITKINLIQDFPEVTMSFWSSKNNNMKNIQRKRTQQKNLEQSTSFLKV
jgi:hypothetical protein